MLIRLCAGLEKLCDALSNSCVGTPVTELARSGTLCTAGCINWLIDSIGDAAWPAVCATSAGADGNPPAVFVADSATVSAGVAAAAGDAPNGVIGGGAAVIAPISVLSVLAYANPALVFCGQKFP
jgi:hypothetical protein